MNLNIPRLKELVSTNFSDVQQIDDSVIRITKKAGELPFAVYYFDVGEELPGTKKELIKYLDRVIGSHYFQGQKSLQWNNYLYFVTSEVRLKNNKVIQTKKLIESDRTYARKFVISEDELDSILTPKIITPEDATPHASILSIWTDRLDKAGFGHAILSDDNLPKRLKLIEASHAKAISKLKSPVRKLDASQAKDVPFMRLLELKNYRDSPARRKYEFGKVNLIVGANGSGKTSLLEAIELFYCGKNNRDPKRKPQYELAANFSNGQAEIVTESRQLQELRDRNLMWYGQLDLKSNNLYKSFAQFNFLDTDAAVGLAVSTLSMEEDLSKLLVGPDASKTWHNIKRVDEAVLSKLRELKPRKKEIKEEIDDLDKQIKAAKSLPRESDSIRKRLEEIINRLGWEVNKNAKEALAIELIEPLSELISLVQQATMLNWIESPIVVDGLSKYCHETSAASKKIEPDIEKLEGLHKKQKNVVGVIKRNRDALIYAKESKRLIDVDVAGRFKEHNKLKKNVETYTIWLAGLDEKALDVLSDAELKKSVVERHESAVSEQSLAETLLANKKSEYENYSELRDQSLNLGQELRQVATKIIQNSNKPDECPLCHTQFQAGDLVKRINVGLDEHIEKLGQELLTKLREQEDVTRCASAVVNALVWLKNFCDRANLAADISVLSALEKIKDINRKLATAQINFKSLNSEILEFEKQGLSMMKLEETVSLLSESGYPLKEFSQDGVERILSTIEKETLSSSKALETLKQQTNDLHHKLETILGLSESGLQELKNALSQLNEKLVSTESLHSKLCGFFVSFPWSGSRPLAELELEAGSVRKVAVDLQAALSKEEQAETSYADSLKRKEHLEPKLKKLRQRVNRFDEVHSVLKDLQEKHSLESAMESALQQNRSAIEDIFSRIHAPAEFKGLGSRWNNLIRKDGTESDLNQISTGQRAAFALSIFFAQNAQLKVAPPVILIDDMIAHVDDLNSLSFLDYLREIVLTGRRQIFFATANNKLSTLFERKFDFLGEEDFRRFDLKRETSSVA